MPENSDLARLESEFKEFKIENSKSHQRIFDRVDGLEKDAILQAERYRVILDNINIVSKKIENIEAKPGRKWENLSDKVLWCIIGAILAFVMAKLGIA